MLGKPHETSFPEETFTVKDGFGVNSEREGLNPASGSYRQFHRQPVPLAGDSPRRTLIHSHSSIGVLVTN